MIEFKGNKNVEEFSALLNGESPRCLAIVAAAFFDETLGTLLGDTKDRSFSERIDDALEFGLLTQNEHYDLRVLKELRNEFAHDLHTNSFDAARSSKVESMKIWQQIIKVKLNYPQLYPAAAGRLLYVVGVIAFRLQDRQKAATKGNPLSELDGSWNPKFWPSTISGPWGNKGK